MRHYTKRNSLLFTFTVLLSALLIIIINILSAHKNYGLEGNEVFSYISSTSMGGYKGICYLKDQTWYNAHYFEDALTATGKECFNYKMVVDNQAMDTHPPFYYILLNTIASFFSGQFSRWYGIGLNIFLMLFVWGGLFLLLQFFIDEKYLSIIFSTLFCCSRFSVNMVLFIRMYVLLMALCIFQTWFHLKLYKQMSENEYFTISKYIKQYLLLVLITILGAYSHYYFIIYQCLISALFVCALCFQKRYHNSLSYTCSMLCSAILYIILYPAALNHIFFKYRGRDAIHKFLKGSSLLSEFNSMLTQYNQQVFKGALFPLIIVLGSITIFLIITKQIKPRSLLRYIAYVMPSFIYFFGISKSSPFVTIRYISPVAAIIFTAIVVWVIKLIKYIIPEKRKILSYIFISLLFLLITVYFGQIPIKDSFFSEKRNIIQTMAKETNCCLYISGDSYNWKMWEDYIYYPEFDKLFFIDGTKTNPITDLEVNTLKQATIFIDTALDKEQIINYLKRYLSFKNYSLVYTTPYTYIILAE